MNIVYSNEDIRGIVPAPSIFLAGPTPRSEEHGSWRPEAVELFEKHGFDGTLFVPEWSTGEAMIDYLAQVEWEDKFLTSCTAIMFWVPRKLPEFPAFTTNVEFGRFVGVRPCVYGRPPDSEKNRYLDWLYTKKTQWLPHETLDETVRSAIALAGPRKVHDEVVHG